MNVVTFLVILGRGFYLRQNLFRDNALNTDIAKQKHAKEKAEWMEGATKSIPGM